MNDASKAAILSVVRSILIAAGSMLAARGVIDTGTVDTVVGSLMTLFPVLWGILEKYSAERKAAAREVAAVHAGIAASNTGLVGDLKPDDVKDIIKTFAVPPTKGESP